MDFNSRARLVFLSLFFSLGTIGNAFAQGTMVRPTPQSADRDSSGNLKKQDSMLMGEAVVRGAVVLVNGSVPHQMVSLFSDCGSVQTLAAVADSRGYFKFDPAILGEHTNANSCKVRAFLEGYRSQPRALADLNSKYHKNLVKLVLEPLASDTSGLVSLNDEQADKGPRKNYEKALDQAAVREWSTAMALFQKATAAYPGYSSAWLGLGVLQRSRGDRSGAEKSFLESVRADPKFAPPLIQLAELEAARGNWQAALAHSQKAIDLNAGAFPDAYALNAMSNASLQNIDAAERSATKGLNLDTEHQYPELEYALGVVLYSKNDVAEAAKHLQLYLKQAPNGPNAEAARTELAQLNTAPPTHSAARQDTGPAGPSQVVTTPASVESASGSGPTPASLQDRNAPLLVTTSDHTCLETISRTQIDTRGRAQDADVVRVEVAISNDKEIYGYVDGRRFSNEHLADMIGYSFSTTGLFSSIARALIARNGATVAFVSEEILNGESVLRYRFAFLTAEAGWSIHYGKQSGEAREEGFFWVNKADLLLRRVAVRAVDIPRNLKLKNLDAVIDYEPETIADRRVLLPYLGQVHVEEGSGMQRVSRMFFDHCRAFATEAVLSFDGSASQTADETAPEKTDLPPDLDIVVSLRSVVSTAAAAANDVITATVAEPVISHGHQLIASGAPLEGHVRPRRGENALVVEFDRVQTRNGWAPFYAHMVSLASNGHARLEPVTTQARARQTGLAFAESTDPEIPGVAKILLTSESAELLAGTQMRWRTELLTTPKKSRPPQLSTAMGVR